MASLASVLQPMIDPVSAVRPSSRPGCLAVRPMPLGVGLLACFGLGPVAGFICRRDVTERVDGWS